MPLLFGAMVGVVALILGLLSQLHNDRTAWIRHTLEVENALSDLSNTVNQTEAVQRGYLLAGDEAFLRVYERVRAQVPAQIAELQGLTADSGREEGAVTAVRAAIQRKFDELDHAVALYRAGNGPAAVASARDGTGRQLTGQVIAALRDMRQTEEGLLTGRTHEAQWLSLGLVISVIALGIVVLAFSAAWVEQTRKAGQELESAYRELSIINSELVAEMASRTEAEGRARQMQKMEAIGQLTGGIAHDFNNMLSVVIGNLNMAQRRLAKGQDDVAGLVDSAMEGAERAATLTSRLMAFARQQPLASQPLDANEMVRGMSDILSRTLGETIVVETVLGESLWRTSADPAQLESALVNLAINARDAMPGGGKLTIQTAKIYLDGEESGAKPGQYVMLAVSDTGWGMTPDVAQRAIEPFFTTKASGKGTGLGLSQVYGFVKQSGGHLKIYSEVGQGTTVKICLPRLLVSDPVAEPSEPHAVEHEADDRTVLVVEDDERVRRFAQAALSDLGYRTVTADNAAQALEQLKAGSDIDLLLTDVVMPETNGRQLAEQAHVLRPGLPVVYMTGFTRDAVLHNGMLDPGVNFLAKPFTVDQLAAKVRTALDRGRAAA